MPSCHDMRKGDVYVCEECGLELEVIKECKDAGTPAEDCGCHPSADPCTFSCCGMEMVKQ
jgi:predicted nucleic acid-binding Zn ribbon protein